MGRKSSREMVGRIIDFLNNSGSPKSITEISESIGSDRKAVKSYLDELVGTGLVKTEKEGRKKVYYISNYENRTTYFNLPLEENQKMVFETIFGTIVEKYKEKTGKTVSKAKAQKIAVGTLEHCGVDLELPYGCYKHGSMAIMSFTPQENYSINTELVPEWEKVEECIEEKVEEYSGISFGEVKKQQYESENMQLYMAKEKIFEILTGKVESQKLQRELYRLLSHTPDMDDKANDLLMDFVSMAPKLVTNRKERSATLNTFNEIWEMVALYRLKSDLREFYSEKMLETRLKSKIEEEIHEVEEAIEEMSDEVKYREPKKEFKKLQGEGKGLSGEEKERKKEELEEMDSSDVARKFDLDS